MDYSKKLKDVGNLANSGKYVVDPIEDVTNNNHIFIRHLFFCHIYKSMNIFKLWNLCGRSYRICHQPQPQISAT